MPRSRGSVKKHKVKVIQQRIKKKTRAVREPVAGNLWKEKATVRENYSAMGLAAAVNQDASVAMSMVTRKGKIDMTKTSTLTLGTGQLQVAGSALLHTDPPSHIDDHDDRSKAIEVITEAASYPAGPRVFMFEGDQEFIEALLAKYGRQDYDRMARDMKLNVFQHTPAQIRKKVEKYERLKAEWEAGERGKGGDMKTSRTAATKLPCSTWNVTGLGNRI